MNFNNSTKYDNFENFIHGEYEIRFELNLAYYNRLPSSNFHILNKIIFSLNFPLILEN